MIRTALDTSVVVASLLEWHPDHERALAAVVRAKKEGRKLVVPVPALIQAFSVMTRLPRGYRVAPDVALDRLRGEFASTSDLVAHDHDEVWKFLDRSVARGVSGGGIHDADILACAERGGAKRLLTLNAQDFERLGPADVEIVVP